MAKRATQFDATFPVDETHQVNIYREEGTNKRLYLPYFYSAGKWQPYRVNGKVFVAHSLEAARHKIDN